MDNPYEPPKAELAVEGVEVGPPAYKLYSVAGIGIATFFGAFFGGGIIMAMNYRRMGQSDEARRTLLWALLATIGLLGVAFALPHDVPSMVFTIVEVILMVQLGKQLQQKDISLHLDSGGALASNWGAAGIGLLAILPLIAILMVFVVAFPELFV